MLERVMDSVRESNEERRRDQYDRREHAKRGGVETPAVVAVTRADEVPAEGLEASITELRGIAPDAEILVVSVLDDASLDALRDAIWRLTGLIRVFLRVGDDTAEEPLALEPGVTVRDVADAIHHELGAVCIGARLWGPSARFDGQRVGPDHPVVDGDTVEVLSPA